MIRGILTIININASQRINGFLYFLKKIPGIKNLLKNINYSFLGFKKFSSIVGIIYNMIAGLISFGLIFGLGIYLPTTIKWVRGDTLNSIMLFILSFFFLSKFLWANLMNPDQESFILVKQMKMNPKVYAISQTIWDQTRGLFSKSLVLALVFKFALNKDPIYGALLGLSITMFTIFMEALHLYIFKKTGRSINDFKKTSIALGVLGLVGTYALVMFTRIPEQLKLYENLTNPFLTLIFTILGIMGFIYLLNYDRYWDIINDANKLETFVFAKENMSDLNFQEVKLRDKDFNEKSLKENEAINKEGYDYLNHIFFKRHKRVVYKPMLIKTSITILIFLAIFIGDKFFIESFGKDTANEFIDGYSLFIIVIYALCNSTAIMKSLFYNCDRSLLRYGFYKRGDSLLKMFSLRLKEILFYNMITVSILCLGLLQLILVYAPERIGQAFPMILSNLLLGVFFSVHYIFVYYILQPFTTDLKTKNPLYNIINFLVYIISYAFIGLGLSAGKMLPFILVFTVLYVSMALALVYKKAPKTFRVK